MANVLTVPNSGIISFDSRAYSDLTVPPLSTSARIGYDGGGGVNITSYTTATTALDRFSVDGTQGRLFSVTDTLTGTLFSVNNITGLPILEVTDQNTVIAGQYNTSAFVLSGTRTGLGTTPIGTNRLSVSGDSTFVGTISTSSHGTSENWNTAFNRTTQYQSLSSTFATNSTVSSVSSLLTPLTVTRTLTGQLLLTSVYQGASGNWQSTYTTVQANSASWEESAEILPTVTNYLSTNNVRLSSATVSNTLSISSVQIRTRPIANIFIGDSTTGNNNATGNHNFVFGLSAGSALTTGSSNVFIGTCAGRVNTTGSSNNFLGNRAGSYNTTGGYNNFLGVYTGRFNSTGGNNNFFGNGAGASNTAGINNNFLGNGAGANSSTGNNNNFFGSNAGAGDPVGYTNVGDNNNFFGNGAGFLNNTGSNNNFFGNGAGSNNYFGCNNTIIGNAANVASGNLCGVIAIGTGAMATQTNQIVLSTADISLRTLKGTAAGPNVFIGNATTGNNNATGNHNFVFGLSAGNALTTGSNNVFVGACAGRLTTGGLLYGLFPVGRNNNFLGNAAGFSNTTGSNNNFLGNCAGHNNTTGSSNNFLGLCAGRSNTTGSFNNFLGQNAGRYNTTGSSNNFLGYSAGNSNTTGSFNNFLGQNAGRYNTTGGSNNFFGNCAGRYNTTGNCNNFVGRFAGCTNTIGSNNTIIGNAANVATNSLSGVIVLGTGAIATESHQVVLSSANVIFRNIGDTFQIGSSAVPNNLTVFGSVSTTGSVFANSISKNIWIPAAAWIPRTTNGCGVDSRELSANKTNYDELLFDAGVNEFAQALVVMPSNYNNGTVAARFYWTCNDPSAPGEGSSVIWLFAGRAFSDIDVLDAAMGTSQSILDSVDVGNYINKLHISEPTPSMTLAGTPAANRPVLFEITRNATSFGDSLGVDARLLGVEIIYTAA